MNEEHIAKGLDLAQNNELALDIIKSLGIWPFRADFHFQYTGYSNATNEPRPLDEQVLANYCEEVKVVPFMTHVYRFHCGLSQPSYMSDPVVIVKTPSLTPETKNRLFPIGVGEHRPSGIEIEMINKEGVCCADLFIILRGIMVSGYNLNTSRIGLTTDRDSSYRSSIWIYSQEARDSIEGVEPPQMGVVFHISKEDELSQVPRSAIQKLEESLLTMKTSLSRDGRLEEGEWQKKKSLYSESAWIYERVPKE